MTQHVLLIADDQEDNRVVLSAILVHHGYTVLLADDGEMALELARDHSPSLVLMDIQMPKMDGWEATRLLKADPLTASIPVIAFSALSRSDSALLEEAGFCAYIQKPVLPRDVVRAVAYCLEPVRKGQGWIELPSFQLVPPVLER